MISEVLESRGIKDFNVDRDRERLATLLEDDSLLFKRILRLVLRHKLERFFNKQINDSDRIEDLIPRSSRPVLVYQLEGNLDLDFPKLTLSGKRFIVILLIIVVSFAAVTSVYISIGVFSIFPYFFLYLALAVAIPWLMLGMISLIFWRFFEPVDWEQISTIDDLLWRLIVDNYNTFKSNNYSRTIDEIDEVCRLSMLKGTN